ncbi:hypothetical protein [Streptomyces sp. E2N166]|uniref:hypothetical protein n=1 Tax=Streptomyces sp. E2N166 TaxID=1851909 RepID=UPI001EE78919|nr:hypothetical protein [Streptomyces sp. E2N166]
MELTTDSAQRHYTHDVERVRGSLDQLDDTLVEPGLVVEAGVDVPRDASGRRHWHRVALASPPPTFPT